MSVRRKPPLGPGLGKNRLQYVLSVGHGAIHSSVQGLTDKDLRYTISRLIAQADAARLKPSQTEALLGKVDLAMIAIAKDIMLNKERLVHAMQDPSSGTSNGAWVLLIGNLEQYRPATKGTKALANAMQFIVDEVNKLAEYDMMY